MEKRVARRELVRMFRNCHE